MSLLNEQAQALFEAAKRDRLTLEILLREPDSPLETTLFHAQQALVKGLKAKLVRSGVIFPRTHDLLELCDLATVNGITVPVARNLLARLAPYAVEFRYLGVVAPAVDRGEAKEAIELLLGSSVSEYR